MFTNFITPARGRTRFYHCLAHAFPYSAGPSDRHRTASCRAFDTDTTRPTISSRAAPSPDTIDRAPSDSLNRLTFVSCFSRNKRRVRHREVTNVFDNSPAENVYIA